MLKTLDKFSQICYNMSEIKKSKKEQKVMKSFSQLKKDIKVGTMIETILNNYKPERNGQIRKVAKVQTNAIAFEIPQEEQNLPLQV